MKTLILLAMLHAGAAGTDAYFTNGIMQSKWGGRESNPIASPFVKTTPGCVAFFSVDVAAHFGGAWLLHRRHHDKLARLLMVEGIADNGINAAYSATH